MPLKLIRISIIRISTLIFCLFLLNPLFAQIKTNHEAKRYVFFLHNRFIEDHDLDEKHPEYGKSEYFEILSKFKKQGFIVFSEKRPSNTDVRTYAKKIFGQIDSLFKLSVNPNNITVIGTSKGGYIAQYVSTYLKNPNVNYVFIGAYQEADLQKMPDINFCGNVLNIYEKSDYFGISALKRKETSLLTINHFEELELNTGLKHGFLFRPMDNWIKPCVLWAKQDYAGFKAFKKSSM